MAPSEDGHVIATVAPDAARPVAAAKTNTFTAVPQPRLVGLSQPFFASTPSPSGKEIPKEQLAALDRVAKEKKTGKKIRVLVAEDNLVNQEVVLRMLKLEQIYNIIVAKDGQEAYDMVKESMDKENYFDLILMDIQMPNLDGIQSTKMIRQMGFSAPIVALTAFAEESNVKECYDSGMDMFLSKPIRRPALKQVLQKFATIPEEGENGDGRVDSAEPPPSRGRTRSEKDVTMAPPTSPTSPKSPRNPKSPKTSKTPNGIAKPDKAKPAS